MSSTRAAHSTMLYREVSFLILYHSKYEVTLCIMKKKYAMGYVRLSGNWFLSLSLVVYVTHNVGTCRALLLAFFTFWCWCFYFFYNFVTGSLSLCVCTFRGGKGGGREQKSLSRSHLAAYIIESEGQYFTTTMFRFFLFFHHLSALRRPKTRVSSRKDFRVMKRQQQNIERATTAKKHENFILCFVRVRVCGSEIKYM